MKASSSWSNRLPITAAAHSVRLGGRVQTVDAGGDGGLEGCRHADLSDVRPTYVGAASAAKHTTFG